MPIAIVVHGGAGTIPEERAAVAQAGCREAAELGWRILEQGGSALDAVEAAVRALEDNPVYNAGTGATLTQDGRIELDAGIMEGRTLQVGAVAAVEGVKNPITLARRVLESPHVLLVGHGAQQFALEQGIELCRTEDLLTDYQYRRWREERRGVVQQTSDEDEEEPPFYRLEVATTTFVSDEGEPAYYRLQVGATSIHLDEERHGTVGAVALDESGLLAAATSTGGIFQKYPGRVGDTPLVGCGFYADEHAAVSCTGQGEDFVRLLLARRAADFVALGASAEVAAQAAIAVLSARATGKGGLIIVDAQGQVGLAHNSPQMAYAYRCSGMDQPVCGI
ncbi:isoaspartyl peptidase/L-asparaginase family protein [Thermogemmatispora sp.]|uniref:isoaspartyl peptidase/L-asparaginase family protein n=1 Tax=Thermogemmatispora sp. TaxID=1968838 RepID=UPI0035E451C4